MPLLVVPLAPEDTERLTLAELEGLERCDRVVFERPGHPLQDRLEARGVACDVWDDELEAGRAGWALVADPTSPRVLGLAHRGAAVSAGPAPALDTLTAAHGAPVVRAAAASLTGLVATMARLRSDDGCPWDQRQTHDSLQVHLIEEAYEVVEAIDEGATGPALEEELGDLLLQVVFHARLAEQDGRFDIVGVAAGIVAKLVRRHPHVFGDVEVSGAGEVLRNWEQIKATDKQRSDPFEGIPPGLPALLAASTAQKRAAALGFEGGEPAARARAGEALERLDQDDSLGDALFWLVAAARARGVDPEGALRSATSRFKSSFSR